MKYINPHDHRQLPTFPDHRNHPGHRQHHVTPISSPLYVVTVIMNPARYYSRYRLYQAFKDQVAEAGAVLYTVEVAFRDRHFEITDPHNPHHIQLRSPSEIWLKESAGNVGVSRLPANWEYMAFVDADVIFTRPDWANETLHKLQHYSVVQMFSQAQDLGPGFELIGEPQRSFCWKHIHGGIPSKHKPNGIHNASKQPKGKGQGHGQGHHNHGQGHGHGHGHHDHDNGYEYPHRTPGLAHPGYAWAYRRSAFADLGGMGDIGILGSGDHQMAMALIGRVQDSIHPRMHQSYKNYWNEWQHRADRHVKRNIGYVEGALLHHWHGKKVDRKYGDRWKILIDEQYNWHHDIKKDPQGLWSLTDRNWKLRDKIRQYFAERNEDSIDL